MIDAWLQRFAPRPRAAARLFCFPFAGGGAAAFRAWAAGMPESLEVVAVQAPGRANRYREAPLASMAALVDGLLPALLPHLDRPFALFGHSMGSAFAHAVAHELVRRGAPRPAQLFVSGRRPPRVPDALPPLHGLPDEAFVAEILRRYGGIPPEVLAEPELMALLLPGLRADMQALETYRPPLAAPLPFPIHAYGGADDPLLPRAHLEAWAAETGAAFRCRTFPGGHFYLDACREALLADIAQALRPVLAAPLREARA